MTATLASVIDLDRYPIEEPDSAAYGGDPPSGLSAGHPRRRRLRRGGGFVTADRIDRTSALWTFFDAAAVDAAAVTRFVTEAFGQRASIRPTTCRLRDVTGRCALGGGGVVLIALIVDDRAPHG